MKPLPPGETIGILGGGQLGRMLSGAAAKLGFDTHIFTPENDDGATRVSARSTIAAYDDKAALEAFAKSVSVVTFEFENVPAATVEILSAAGAVVRPGAKALAVAQDRVVEKDFLNQHGLPTAPYAKVDSLEELKAAMAYVGAPSILKTRRLGYDGKGQARILDAGDAVKAWNAIGGQAAILEGFAQFEREVSVVAARGVDGAFKAFDLCENVHEGGILRTTRAPARASALVCAQAEEEAHALMDALEYVGVLAIEFFLMPDGSLWANEFAPRVHNSGHWTADACVTGQFEQHIRAVAGWPLGDVTRLADVEMINLIGDDVNAWERYAADPDARVTLYGKREARAGRKMGHVTRLLHP